VLLVQAELVVLAVVVALGLELIVLGQNRVDLGIEEVGTRAALVVRVQQLTTAGVHAPVLARNVARLPRSRAPAGTPVLADAAATGTATAPQAPATATSLTTALHGTTCLEGPASPEGAAHRASTPTTTATSTTAPEHLVCGRLCDCLEAVGRHRRAPRGGSEGVLAVSVAEVRPARLMRQS
jgi:hypothetical protein